MSRIVGNVQQAANDAAGLVDDSDLTKRAWDSAAMLDYWRQTEAIMGGVKTMRAQGEMYLPRFVDEPKAEYEFRLAKTKMTNIYSDIVESLATKPFEEEVSLISGEGTAIPEAIERFVEDVDGTGNNLTVFAAVTFFNGINSAIDWILIDYPSVQPGTIRTVADAKRANVRPFWSHVLGVNVLEARSSMVDGKERLNYVRIFEPGKPDHIRIFEHDGTRVNWKLYQKNTQTGKFELHDQGRLSIDIIPMVPFSTGRRDGRSFKYDPPMQAAADLQIELYGEESALKFAKIMTAYPMLSGNGVDPEKNPDGSIKNVPVGPNRILFGGFNKHTGSAGTWSYIEPSATSLKFLAEEIKETITNLRELGRQPLTANSGNLTVITTAFAAGKAKSAVAQWALMLKDAIENALVITAMWYSISREQYDPEVNVYTEFDNFLDGGADLTELGNARKNGDLSQETYLSELKRRKVLSPEFDFEAEQKRILKETPGDEFDDETPGEPNPDNTPANNERPGGSGGTTEE